MEQVEPKPSDSGVVAHLLVTEMAIKSTDIDTGSSTEAKETQIAPGNGTPIRTNRVEEQLVPSSSELSQSRPESAGQEKKQEETAIDSEKKMVPKTPVLSRLPTPDLSDVECGNFCACCRDTSEGDGKDNKKWRWE